MTYRYGFIASDALVSKLDQLRDRVASNDSAPLYVLRDDIVLMVVSEMLDATMVNLVKKMPETKTTPTVLKVIGFIKSTISVLLKQILGKATNAEVLPSTQLVNDFRFQDAQNLTRIGIVLPDQLASSLNILFAQFQQGDDSNDARLTLQKQLTLLTEVLVDGMLGRFLHVLKLGMIKRKAGEMTQSGIKKALASLLNQSTSDLQLLDIQVLSAHINDLVIEEK